MEAGGRFAAAVHPHHHHHHHHHRRSGWDSSSAQEDYDEAYDPEPGGRDSTDGDSRYRRQKRRHPYGEDYSRGRHDSSWEHDKYDGSDYRSRSSRDADRGYDYDDSDRDRSRRDGGGRSKASDFSSSDGSRSPYPGWQQDDSFAAREEQQQQQVPAVPTGTVVVKGLSQKTVEVDLYRALEGWGPLRHVRVIKEKVSGVSRGFAFVDFPSVEAAERLMQSLGNDGLIVNGRRLFFEYSRPTGGGYPEHRPTGQVTKPVLTVPADWICSLCGYLNFARRVVCLQCNEARGEEATDLSVAAYRGLEPAPSHVLAVRGLDDNVDEEILHYEFSKHAPIKDLRLIRDKFTHVSRGYAFVHFHSVEDAGRALEATNGTAIDKNGQILRVAFAKSPYGIHGGPSATAAAAAAAASCAQQYDASGWEPKEYEATVEAPVEAEGTEKTSGFVWDESSGYYYDAATMFYYDANRDLYYDGTNGIWYTFNQELQQYQPYTEAHPAQEATVEAPPAAATVTTTVAAAPAITDEAPVLKERPSTRKQYANAVISAPAVRSDPGVEKEATPDTALAKAKKDKEKTKEVRLPLKNPGKKKMNNLWKQWTHEGSDAAEDRSSPKDQVLRGDDSEAVIKTETVPRVGSKRRFTEAGSQHVYRDRAAERRSLYGLSVPGDPMEEMETSGSSAGVQNSDTTYEAVTVDKAIDDRNVGKRMLRSMGWQQGSGLGRQGTGIVEPVQAHMGSERAGLGSQRSRFEAQPGDSYRAIIQKKSFARFHDML